MATVAALGLPALASAEEEAPAPAEIQSTEIPVSGPWVKVKVACILPEGSVCSGSIGMHGVAHSIGAGKVARLSALREISLLGGEMRPVAIRLLRGVWTAVSEGTEREAAVAFRGRVGPTATRIVQLVPAG